MADIKHKVEARNRRHNRVRRRLSGISSRPRLSVYRSNRHIYAQIIDDTKGVTLVAASSRDEDLSKLKKGTTKDSAKAVGELVAKRAIAKKIQTVVFDRGGYLFHGRVKALADAARAGGLVF